MEPVCVADFEEHARISLSKPIFEYYASGANEERTLEENVKEFSRLKLRPRVLMGISKADMRTSVLGNEISMPICVAPTALQKMAHPDGELGTARAAASADTCMIVSFGANVSFEELIKTVPEGLKWLHIDIMKDRDLFARILHLAEKAGYKAVVLTIDAPLPGRRIRSLKSRLAIPPHLALANYEDVVSREGSSVSNIMRTVLDPTFSWRDVEWVKSISKLPVVLKGILTAEDATKAVERGVNGIIVSNHGGRQLDCVPATIEALSEIVDAVKGRVEVYLDGGVRLGTDVLKALALGARAVFVGRPVIWGLAYQGEDGVKKVLEILREEFQLAMTLSGRASLSKINKSVLWQPLLSQL